MDSKQRFSNRVENYVRYRPRYPDGLIELNGRLLSSSYAPAEGETGCSEMLTELERIFERYSESGTVLFEYDTEVYWGSPGS